MQKFVGTVSGLCRKWLGDTELDFLPLTTKCPILQDCLAGMVPMAQTLMPLLDPEQIGVEPPRLDVVDVRGGFHAALGLALNAEAVL
jgi:hypothetical protein